MKQQDIEMPTHYQGAAAGLTAGIVLCALLREGVAGVAAQGPLLSWKGLWALSGATLISTLLGRRSDQRASGTTGRPVVDAAPFRAAAPPQGLRQQAETPPVAPAEGAAGPARRNRAPRSRRLWGPEDGFTMSGTRA